MKKTTKRHAEAKKTKKGASANDHRHLVPVMLNLLKTAKSPDKGVNNQYIQRYILSQKGIKLDRRQVQMLLRDIRLQGLVKCLIGDNDGYHIAASAAQAEAYEKKLISLIKELTEWLGAFHNQAVVKFGHYGKKDTSTRKNVYVVTWFTQLGNGKRIQHQEATTGATARQTFIKKLRKGLSYAIEWKKAVIK